MYSGVFNMVGLGLILFAVILHIVCIALPHYGNGDFDFGELEKKLKERYPDGNMELPDIDIKADIGVWKICFEGNLPSLTEGDPCLKFGSKTDVADKEMDAPDWVKAVQAMSIIGVLVAGLAGALSGLHLFQESRGDRLRVMPILVFGCCAFGATVLMIGNIVFVAKYRDIMSELPMGLPQINDLLRDLIHLDWGFALDIVACIKLLIGGSLHLVAKQVTNSLV